MAMLVTTDLVPCVPNIWCPQHRENNSGSWTTQCTQRGPGPEQLAIWLPGQSTSGSAVALEVTLMTTSAQLQESLIAGLDSPLEHGTGMRDWII